MFNAISRGSASLGRSLLVSKTPCHRFGVILPRTLCRTNQLRLLNLRSRDFGSSSTRSQRATEAVAVDEFEDEPFEVDVQTQRPPSNSRFQEPIKTGPVTKFQELADHKLVSKIVVDTITQEMGLTTMTQVQSLTISKMLKGVDTVAQARTGTGKTLAFLLPLLQNILSVDPTLERGQYRGRRIDPDIRAIIISPTRELAEQIAVEARKVVKNTGVIVQTAVGGSLKREGLRKIQTEGCHILVGTPGRLQDILRDERFGIQAPNLSALVLDEADRLLDQGFYDAIVDIQNLLPDRRSRDRQTLLFSATIPKEIMHVVRQTMKPDFQFVKTVQEGEILTHEKVPQKIVDVRGLENVAPALLELFRRETTGKDGPPFKAIVYFNATSEVVLAAAIFRNLMYPPGPTRNRPLGSARLVELHGRLTQMKRTYAADAFRRAESAVLFSSDVTARGMDFPNVTHVIQVGMPQTAELYVHRIGRTARGDKNGEGWLFRLPFERHSKMLSKFPLKGDNSLETAKVDMKQIATLPEDVVEILSRVSEATALVPAEVKTTAYMSSLGGNTAGSLSKPALIQALNDRAKYGWGSNPPKVSPRLAEKLGLTHIEGVQIGHEPRPPSGDYEDSFSSGSFSRGGDRGFPRRSFSKGDSTGYPSRYDNSPRSPPSSARFGGGPGVFSRDRPSSQGYDNGERPPRASIGSRFDRNARRPSDEFGGARKSYEQRDFTRSPRSGFDSSSRSRF